MSASAGALDDDELLPQHLVDLPSADLVARLRSLLAASSADSSDATHILAELERRHHEAEDRVRVSEELAATMRERVKVLQRSATAAHEKIRRAAETEARPRAEIDSQKHTAAVHHQAVLETLEQRALRAEAQLRRASESEALLKTKIQEVEGKAAMVEANYRREMEAIKGRAVKAEVELKKADKTAMNFHVRLEAIISEAEHAAAILEVSHRLQIHALKSRVTDESNLRDEMSHRDRMAILATHFEARLEVIASEAKRAADGVKDRYRVEIEALQQLVTETKERLSDEISKRKALALECQQHLLQASNDISEGKCLTNEDKVKLLYCKISADKKMVAELDSEIRDTAAEIQADLRRGIEEDEDTIAALEASIAKKRAMTANENYEEEGQLRSSSPTHIPSAQTSSEHHDVIDLTTSEDDV